MLRAALVVSLLIIIGCLGKTAVRNIYFISPQKRTVFIAPPVNFTSQYLIDERIRSQINEVFSSRIRFSVVDRAEDSDLYILLNLQRYQIQDVGDYGFGNREILITASLFVSDSQYKKNDDKEQPGRYYYRGYPLNIDELGYVYEGDNLLSDVKLEEKAIYSLANAVYELMLSGKLPSR